MSGISQKAGTAQVGCYDDAFPRINASLPPAQPVLMDEFKERLKAVMPRILRGETVDARPVVEIAEALMPGAGREMAEQQVSGLKGAAALLRLAHETAFSRGEVLICNCIGMVPEITHGRVVSGSWRHWPYLDGLTVHSANMRCIEAPAGQVGISLGNLALTDWERAREDAASMFRGIRQTRGGDNPFFCELNVLMSKPGFNFRKYGEHFGQNRNMHHELTHARDWSFASALTELPEDTPEGREHRVLALFKPASEICGQLLAGRPQDVDREKSRQFLGEYSAELGGIISEVRTHIDAGQKELAYMAFLDYMGVLLSMYNTLQRTGTVPDAAHSLPGSLQIQRLPALGLDSVGAILAAVKDGGAHPADGALTLLNNLRALDLWDDAKRAELLAAKKAGRELLTSTSALP